MSFPLKVSNRVHQSDGSQDSIRFPTGAFDQFSQSSSRSQQTGNNKKNHQISKSGTSSKTTVSGQRQQHRTRDLRESEPVAVLVNGRRIETRLRERQVWDASRNQWRTVAIYADGYAEGPVSRPDQGDSVRDKQLLIRDPKGRAVIDLGAARRRMEEIIAHGGWTKLTAGQAQAMQERRIEASTKPIVSAKFEAYKSRYGLTYPVLRRMNLAQRYQWLAQAASRTLGKEVGAQVRQLLTPQTAAMLLGMAALQASGAGISVMLINIGLSAEQARQFGAELYEVHQATQTNNVYEMEQAASKLRRVAGQLVLLAGTIGMTKVFSALLKPRPKTPDPTKNKPSSSQSTSQALQTTTRSNLEQITAEPPKKDTFGPKVTTKDSPRPLPEREAGRVHQVPGFTNKPVDGKVFSQYMHAATVRLAKLVKAGDIDASRLWGALTEARYQAAKGLGDAAARRFRIDRQNDRETKWAQTITYIANNPPYKAYAGRIFKLFPYRKNWEDGKLDTYMTGTIKGKEIELTHYSGSIKKQNGKLDLLAISSPYDDEFGFIFSHIDELKDAALKAPNNDTSLRYLAEIHWWLAHACPNGRGSAAVADSFVRTIAQARGMSLGEWKTAPDLEALFSSMEDFVKAYPTFFKTRP
ncbi:Avirulence protein [Noviherbaspirillum humi]|uniref:Avirulence protein n=1 Tax=Noviherbaspirillum humi TaxID=1688639 RepID=A0A239I143_9BURK|nr:hypothetical protein [Noviherbaspirillum humi]SNS87191.1 Avirulence protein [Noviherbaspirillum humi]